MTDAEAYGRAALGGWLILAVRQAALTAITFGGVVVLGRVLGPGDFALYGYTTIGVTIALGIGDLGLGARLIRGRAEQEDLRRAFGLQLVVLLGALAAAAGAIVLAPGSGEERTAAALICVAVALAALQALPTALLERRLSFRTLAKVEVGQRALFTAAAIALAVTGTEVLAIPLAAVAAGAVGYSAAVASARWAVAPLFTSLRGQLGGFASDWFHGKVATQLAYATYPVVGGLLLTPADVGYIVLALTITSFAVLLAPLVARATFPAMAAGSDDARLEVFRPVFHAFVVTSLPVLAVIAIAAEPIVRLLFGNEWLGAVDTVRATCLPTAIGVVLTPSLPLLYLMLDTRLVKRILMGWAAINLLLALVLAEPLGPLAPAIAGALSAGTAVLLLDRALARVSGFTLSGEMRREFAAAIGATAVGLTIALLVGGTFGAVAGSVLCLTIYGVAVRRWGVQIDPRDLVRAFKTTLRERQATSL